MQECQLSRTDRASAFVSQNILAKATYGHDGPCKIFLLSSLAIMQNLVVVCHPYSFR